ncbi:M23 family metallopeptidase [Mucilaginibacter sabulilitoris]|uniref:M23 family metallopeptidase n=1 Tax=Mucilaginibacter sabulilitoris TaxID=1173583 RepID=A0ABZ0TQM6_9SPHI|nr:M23 family metallopeptidase [Mucilaginibacter sabulilitoris]WPU93445.1 M23 family metallopeptidase [Mucilaginibacter sabulilitoris]
MQKITLLAGLIFFILSASAQDNKSVCDKINNLNTAILNGQIKRPDAAKQFKTLINQLRQNRHVPEALDGWVFPLRKYNYHAIGGNGSGYSDKGYHYLDGNKHSAHPAHDIFINDKNQDCLDDKSSKPVDVLAVDYGIVIACSNEWEPTSGLRGGKYIWINDNYGQLIYYAHNQAIFVKPGDEVKAGQTIARVGRTGYNAYKKRSPTHLHFSAFKLVDDLPVPYNPYEQLKKAKTL